jgi:uncharacterized protein (DUF305 family)
MIRKLVLLALLLSSALVGCGEDHESEHAVHTALNGDRYNDADVDFATDMIPHHAQALAMVDLTRGRQLDPAVAQLAEAILMAQGPEIQQMTDWLTEWDQPIPETVRDHVNGGHDMHDTEESHSESEMPGMMSADDMAALGTAQGAEFRTMWLEMMIEHHDGAIEMAKTEQADGAHTPARKMAADIIASQSAEIEQMKKLLG